MLEQLLSFYRHHFTFSKLNLQRLFFFVLLAGIGLATTEAINTMNEYGWRLLGNYAVMGLGACLLAGFAMLALSIISR